MTTVLLVAGAGGLRRRLETALRGVAGLRLIDAYPLDDPAREVERARPDVVLLDLGLRVLRPGSSAAARVREVAAAPGAPPVVVLVERTDGAARTEARRSGARGVLPRAAGSGEIVAAILAAAAGLIVFHPDALVPRRRAAGGVVAAAGERLSAREREVLVLLAEGFGNKAIAARLGISTHTAKFHVAAILGKLGAGTRAEAVTLGVRRGLLLI